MEIKKEHDNNVYAYNIKNEIKHISEVTSGRGDYFCMGCNREMQAKKGDLKMHHFSHDPKDTIIKGKCTFSDETHRHKLAKDILQRIKQVKVPPLYKYPPPGIDGVPYKIRNSEIIYAHSVKNEIQFYEDENGVIQNGRDIDFDKDKNKYLLIRPDVAFFDINDIPILLIEIVATHKIDSDKLSKIRKLGINTIQISIPKDSPEEIENTFYKTNRTDWVYNYEQEETEYIQFSEGANEGIPLIDEFQRKLLKATESYKCRASELSNLIRGLTKSLESQPYRDIEQSIRGELRRVEENTERYRDRRRELERKYERELEEEFRNETSEIKREGERLDEISRKFQEDRRDLETRYFTKRSEFERIQREYRPKCSEELNRVKRDFERLGQYAVTTADRKSEIEREERTIEEYFNRETERVVEDFKLNTNRIMAIRERRANLQNMYQKIEDGIRNEFERDGERIRSEFETNTERIRGEAEKLRREVIAAIESRNCERKYGILGRIKDILDAGQKLVYIRDGQNRIKRLRRAKELFDSGAWKS